MAVITVGGQFFEWDDAKSVSNLEKHGISFAEAVTVFFDVHSLLKADPIHSEEEDRFLLLGRSFERRMLAVVHVERGERLRIISARRTTLRERREYERRDKKSGMGR